jgi:hypothetical protein
VLLTGPWKTKQGATSPPYRATLRQANKQPVDLSDAYAAYFVMRLRGQTDPAVNAEANIIQEGDADTGTDVGVVEYDWVPGDLDLPGIYNVEFVLYDINGQPYARVPNDSYLELWVLGSLSETDALSPPPQPLGMPSTATTTATATVTTP